VTDRKEKLPCSGRVKRVTPSRSTARWAKKLKTRPSDGALREEVERNAG